MVGFLIAGHTLYDHCIGTVCRRKESARFEMMLGMLLKNVPASSMVYIPLYSWSHNITSCTMAVVVRTVGARVCVVTPTDLRAGIPVPPAIWLLPLTCGVLPTNKCILGDYQLCVASLFLPLDKLWTFTVLWSTSCCMTASPGVPPPPLLKAFGVCMCVLVCT